jgi:hypothetical protein
MLLATIQPLRVRLVDVYLAVKVNKISSTFGICRSRGLRELGCRTQIGGYKRGA